MKKLKNEYKNPEDGILMRGHPHRNHNRNKKKRTNLKSRKLKHYKANKEDKSWREEVINIKLK